MPNVPRREAADAEIFGEHYHRRIYQAEMEISVAPIDFHGPLETVERRWSISECPSCEVVHEDIHGRALVAQEVIELRQHQARNLARARQVDRVAKAPVVRRTFHKVVEQRAGVADQGGRATDGHRTARARRPAPLMIGRCRHFWVWDDRGTAPRREQAAVG